MLLRPFLPAFIISTLWINASEVFRYFVIVMPAMRRDLGALPEVAPMSLTVFSIWGVWDTVLTLGVLSICWLAFANRREDEADLRTALRAGSLAWAMFFLLFWIGMVNMNLSRPALALVALPLAWLEMVVAARLNVWAFRRYAVARRPAFLDATS